MISVFILTLNEADNIAACLDTLAWTNDVHLLDSGSTDRTTEIAAARGARIWSRTFDNYAAQQNWALDNIPFKHPWVLLIDADERVTPSLQTAMLHAVDNPGAAVAFRIQRRDFFLGTWLRHVQMTAFYDRLFRPEKMRYERAVHQISLIDGPVASIPGYLDHFPFSKGVSDWVQRHNKYSTTEAAQVLANRRANTQPTLRAALFHPDLNEKKRNLKEFYYRLPARPLLKFLLMYVAKRGFLDGKAGFAYSVLISFYEYLIGVKIVELQSAAAAGSIAPAAAAIKSGESAQKGQPVPSAQTGD